MTNSGYTHFLQTPIEYLKGVGPDKAIILKKELEIFTFGDLLRHYPYKYVDRSKFYTVAEARNANAFIQLKGKISHITKVGGARTIRMTANFTDETDTLELVWFNGFKWLENAFSPLETYVIYGKPTIFNNKVNISHPETDSLESLQSKQDSGYRALYNTSEKMKTRGIGMDSKGMSKLVANLFLQLRPDMVPENLPAELINKYKIPGRFEAFRMVHFPKDVEEQNLAIKRFKFEELFLIQVNLIKNKVLRSREKGIIFEHLGEKFNQFYEKYLPFELTNAQKRVLKEIRKDTLNGRQMNRLLQGDVGSGKTIVALISMLMALDNGYQAALMAPTEILAQQHFKSIWNLVYPMGLRVELLTGSVKGKKKNEILHALEQGEIDIIIGTHALIEETVIFKNLGIVVIDEQHRFGVAQRAKLWKKNIAPPHILVMTATPIPRTLAMTLYGDLDVSMLDELPPGRKSIKTIHKTESGRLAVTGFIRQQVDLGRQVYIVYPLIEESEKMDLKDLMAGFEYISTSFPLPQYRVSVVHGKMKSDDKDKEMARFVKGETHIMVATTVIEVGVDVPNASVMVIENSERFGLSQLHQLRGRVGRGAEQSYCILITGHKLSHEGRKRINTMVETNDGFKISEVDLEIRGPGELDGLRQSGGINLKMANLVTDGKILEEARSAALEIIENDPSLEKPEYSNLKRYFREEAPQGSFWGKIS